MGIRGVSEADLERIVEKAVAIAIRRHVVPKLDQDAKCLTVDQVANVLGCSGDQVSDLVTEGRIEAINVASPGAKHRALRISVGALKKFQAEAVIEP